MSNTSTQVLANEDQFEVGCEYCDDTGIIYMDEDDGEGHIMRGTVSRVCLCKRKQIDD